MSEQTQQCFPCIGECTNQKPFQQLHEYYGAIAHDVRSPLHTITLHGECLVDGLYGDLTDEQTEIAQKLLDAGRHLTGLVDNLLVLPGVVEGKVSAYPSEVDLDDSLRDCLMAISDKAKSTKVDIVCQYLCDTAAVCGDRAITNQILFAVFGFAIKASQGGCIQVLLRKTDSFAEVTLCDRSVCLEESEITAILGPIGNLIGCQDLRFEGREVGLALARQLISTHKGQFELCSDPKSGWQCSIRWPLA